MRMPLTSARFIRDTGMHRSWTGGRPSYLVAAALIAVAVTASAGRSGATERPPVAPARSMVGVFTGEFASGAPIYRLPPVNVTGYREDAMAKGSRDEQYASPTQRIL